MNSITVSFFGHRDFNEQLRYESKLDKIIDNIMKENDWVEFLVGRNGEFDIFVSSAIVQAKERFDNSTCYLNLILPYVTSQLKKYEDCFLEYYDGIEICQRAEKAHFKEAFKIRNREMIDRSDIVICYVERENGGAYHSMKYALKKGKKVINLFESKHTL